MSTKQAKKSQVRDAGRPLNEKQRRFVDEYLADLNATQAAIRAGYSKRTAAQQGWDLLRNPKVEAAIAEGKRERGARTQITQDRVLQEVARIAFLDLRKALNADGSLKAITELDDDTAAALAGLDLLEEFEGHGEDRQQIGWTKKMKLADKVRALELLMRHMGMLNDKVKLQGDAENPLVLLLKQMQGTALKPSLPPDNTSD